MPTQTEQPPTKPVGVTKPEMRQPPARNPDIPVSAPDHPGIPTSTPQNPNIPLSTSENSCIPSSTSQYSNIPTPTSQYLNLPNLTPQDPTISTSAHQFPNISTTTPHCPIVSTPSSLNAHLSNTTPNPTETLGNLISEEKFSSTNARESKLARVIAPDDKTVFPGTSIDNQQSYKDLVESAKKTIEKISLENMAQQTSQTSSNKRLRSSLQSSHHVTLHHSSQSIVGPPMFTPGGHMTSLPPMNFPFPGPSNVRFRGFVGPLQPFLPAPHPDLMHVNGPLSAPNLFTPAPNLLTPAPNLLTPAPNLLTPPQLLFQYGSPFPDSHPRRTQR